MQISKVLPFIDFKKKVNNKDSNKNENHWEGIEFKNQCKTEKKDMGNLTIFDSKEASLFKEFEGLVKESYNNDFFKPKNIEKRKEKLTENAFNEALHYLKFIQEAHPLCIVGGSCGLYLQNIVCERRDGEVDLDLVLPFYQKLDIKEIIKIEEQNLPSGNDFDYNYSVTFDKSISFDKEREKHLILDVLIDSKQKYEIIEFYGFKYKVIPALEIIEKKLKYALKTQGKHRRDLFKLLINNPK